VSISFTCPGCGAESTVPNAAAGKVVACAGCGVAVQLPAADAEFEVLDAEPVTPGVRLRPVVVAEEVPDGDEGGRPRSRRRKPAKRGGGGAGVWVVLLGVLGRAGGAAAVYLLGGQRQPAAEGRPAGPVAWAPFSPPGTSLTVELPGVPAVGETQPVPVRAGRLDRTPYTLTSPGEDGRPLTFDVTVFTHAGIPAWAQGGKGSITEYVADRDAAAAGPAEGVTVDGRPGFRYVRGQGGAGEVRVYFGNGRDVTFKVSVAGEGVGPDHPTVRRVLESIRYR
jgi:hypothetical protein